MLRPESSEFNAAPSTLGADRLGQLPHPGVLALRDFSADRRLLGLAAMALIVGTGGAGAAWALSRLINVVTNLAYFGAFSSAAVSIADNTLGLVSVLVPVGGCLIIGLMARYGSEKIRGHGIPEAIEAILIGRSRIQGRVAVLKPLSSAISIGTGGPFGAEGPIIMTGGAMGSLFGATVSSLQRRAQDITGSRGGRRHERHVRNSGCGDPACRGIAAVRMEAAQLCARGRCLGGGGGVAILGVGNRSPIPAARPALCFRPSRPALVRRLGSRSWSRIGAADRHGVRERGSVSSVCRSTGCGGQRSAAWSSGWRVD